ncbi:MAG: hypothetical protein ACRETO_04395 [Gammaproteobacteria bacterium]
MQPRTPGFIVPMSFLATLPLPPGCAWADALVGHADSRQTDTELPFSTNENSLMQTIEHLGQFDVIELRRYTTTEGQRQNFATYFESFFPEAFEQLGAMVLGSFGERGSDTRFTWLRGFHDINARAIVNAAFYYGPLWKEHRNTVNSILPDSDNVLLLRPLDATRRVMLLPAVDPVNESSGAQGVVVMQIFAIKDGAVDAFAQQAETVFARYRCAGVREAGVLVTLDVPNNFPQLPFRTDGPYLVWLGLLKDDRALKNEFDSLEQSNRKFFADTGLLRSEPELVVMDPTRRSRLRWFNDWQ